MYTAAGIASQIVTAIVTEFSQTHRINPAHLLEKTESLTPVEVMRASIALWTPNGPLEIDPEPWVEIDTGRRYPNKLPLGGSRFEPRRGFEQGYAHYGLRDDPLVPPPPQETVYDEQGELDPEPWVCDCEDAVRLHSRSTIQPEHYKFGPRPGFEQRPTRYGVAS